MQQVQREGEVRDELGARDEQEEEGDAVVGGAGVGLQGFLRGERERLDTKNVPAETGTEPTDPQRPAGRRVAPEAPPAEHEVGGERFPRRQGGEEQEARGAEVVEQLERDDLRQDAQGGAGRRGVRGG